ncbi:hypothetical protein ACHAWF_001312, partial [Thalassiosira exigua]
EVHSHRRCWELVNCETGVESTALPTTAATISPLTFGGMGRNHLKREEISGDGAQNTNMSSNEQSDSAGSDDDFAGKVDNDSRKQKPRQSDAASDGPMAETPPTIKKKKVRRLKLSATHDFNAKLQKRGIVYLARVPPRMGPAKVKTLLSDFGNITRVYLVEEDKTVRKRRRKAGGSGGKRYTEGWVEFESKKAAKLVGETLNMTRVTNHKGSIHYDDLWNVKYLRGFKWSHLTEKVAYERRVREQKLRVEMMEVRRENALYMAQVEAGKKLDHIEERRRKRQEKERESGGRGAKDDEGMAKKKRKIRQKKPFEGDKSSTKSAILGSLV